MTDLQTTFIAENMDTMLSISNNRNLILADFVLFTKYDNDSTTFQFLRNEQEMELLMHHRGRRCDIKEEIFLSIPKLCMYLLEQSHCKSTIVKNSKGSHYFKI